VKTVIDLKTGKEYMAEDNSEVITLAYELDVFRIVWADKHYTDYKRKVPRDANRFVVIGEGSL